MSMFPGMSQVHTDNLIPLFDALDLYDNLIHFLFSKDEFMKNFNIFL